MRETEKSLLLSMIANGCEFRKEMAVVNGKEYTIDEINRVASVGMEAIEKAMPKRCIKDDNNRDCCPSCKWIIGYEDTIQPFCHNCGQALDWREKGGAE